MPNAGVLILFAIVGAAICAKELEWINKSTWGSIIAGHGLNNSSKWITYFIPTTKSRSASGAIFFGVVAVVIFIATPMGAGLPGALSTFISTFDHAATPVFNGKAVG